MWNNLLTLAVSLAASLSAQVTGSIEGTVTDPTGAVIAGASVHARSEGGTFERSTTTNQAGYYRVIGLPAGSYRLKFESPGFQVLEKAGQVREGAPLRVDVMLQLGSVSESVVVSAAVGQINASMAQIGSGGRAGKVAARGIRVRGARWNTEEYDHYRENEFLDPQVHPLSTFGADVDTASYSNVRRMLREGDLPSPGAVRIEELVNYFSYNYPLPRAGLPFSITADVAECPWQPKHKLMRIGLRTAPIASSDLPASNLVFLIDVSGSMDDPAKLPLVKRALALLVEQMRERDRIAIAVYAGAAGVVLPPVPGSEKDRILGAIEELRPGGSTYGSAGIRLAYQLARESFLENGNNRVILATDGDFNVGVSSDDELVKLIETERDSGISLSVLGFGMGNYKDSKMEKLADHGNGNYAYIDSLAEARKVLVEQMSATLLTVAKDVKLQVEFNPARVAAYRLVGYENRILRPEEFNDDKKDAGDLGAGHQVTAFYEIVPPGEQSGVVQADRLRYQRTSQTVAGGSGEWALLKFRYKPPDSKRSLLFEQAVNGSQAPVDSDFHFAAAVAQFGMLLRDSKFKGESSFDAVLAAAKRAASAEARRQEFLAMVEQARRLTSRSSSRDAPEDQ